MAEEAAYADRAERPDRIDLRPDKRMDRERLGQRRAERDDARDEVGPALGDDAREVPAAALADDGGALALALDQDLDLLLEPLHGSLRAVDVHPDAGALRVVVRAAQPARHERERIVAREEARDQEDRLAAAVLDALAAEDRVTQERCKLEADAGLTPERWPGEERERGHPSVSGHSSRSGRRVSNEQTSIGASVPLFTEIGWREMRAVTLKDGESDRSGPPGPCPRGG